MSRNPLFSLGLCASVRLDSLASNSAVMEAGFPRQRTAESFLGRPDDLGR